MSVSIRDLLVSRTSCIDCLSNEEKDAAIAYYLAKGLALAPGQGGIDLTDAYSLRGHISCWCVDDASMKSFLVFLAYLFNYHYDNEATWLDAATLRSEAKCLTCVPRQELQQAQIAMLYSLLMSLEIVE